MTKWTCCECGAENEAATPVCPCGREPRTTLADGTQVYPGHRKIRPDGQQENYVVLAEEERTKGFVRPLRFSYVHAKCGTATRISRSIAETYARHPKFYNGTFCVGCGTHFALDEFTWDDGQKVGS